MWRSLIGAILKTRPPPEMAALSAEMVIAADNAGIPENFRKFLIDQEILTLHKFGLLASTESEVAKEIIEVATSGGIKFELKHKVAIKELWLVCRKDVDSKKSSNKPLVIDQDAPLSEEDVNEIKVLWSRVHGFVIPEAWILSAGLVGRISRQVTRSPPQMEVILVESLRPRSCAEKTPGTIFQVLTPGKPTETQVILADSVTRPIELYLRCRAFFVSVAYVTIKHPQFFDFQSALFASDKILSFVTQSFKGHFAPVSFYVSAWAATIHHFCEEIRLHDKTLSDCVKATGEWQHKWTNFTPPQEIAKGGDANPDLPKALQDEVDSMKIALKDWQSKYDNTQREFTNFKRNHIQNRFLSESSNDGGGGRGRGKGAGKNNKPKNFGRGNGGNDKRGRENDQERSDRQRRSPNRNGGRNNR